mmetsp:Transcript_20068/g.34496  ORF Transcript_20068/g.34496 Transcript_20068/m.34496 type:complete len:125 (-) Transcript_20068:4112-4486(-)
MRTTTLQAPLPSKHNAVQLQILVPRCASTLGTAVNLETQHLRLLHLRQSGSQPRWGWHIQWKCRVYTPFLLTNIYGENQERENRVLFESEQVTHQETSGMLEPHKDHQGCRQPHADISSGCQCR